MITSRQCLLSLSITCAFAAQANSTTQQEIAVLRQEVQQLKVLLEQQKQQQVQAGQALAQIQTQTQKLNTPSDLQYKFYGNVRLDALYQIRGSAADRLYNNINKVPLKGNNESKDRLKSTLSATRLGLDIKNKINGQDISGKLEVDFLGGSNFDALRIRHAYVNYDGWLLGQTWSNFAVPDYMPETIDALGYVGGSVKRTVQARYTYPFDAKTQLVIAAEDPKDASSKMRLPALTLRLNHQINDDGRFSLRTMVDEKHSEQHSKTAWGVGLGLQYALQPQTIFKADYYHVNGDSSFVSWTNPGFLVSANQTDLLGNSFDSITAGVTHQFDEKWRTTLAYGYMKSHFDDDYLKAATNPTEINKEMWQAWANVFYSPVKPLSFGIEYIYGERTAAVAAQNGSTKGEDNRFNLVAIYNF